MPPSTPTITLSPGQDTGPSDSDGITDLRFLQITGTATPGNRVTLFEDVNHDGQADFPDVTVGGVFAGGDGTFSTVITLTDGVYAIAAVADDGTTISGVSAPINLTVDSTPPTLASISLVEPGTTDASDVHFVVTFSEPVTTPLASDFSILSSPGIQGASVLSITPVQGSQGASYTVDVATGTGSGTLALEVDGASVTDIAGNQFSGLLEPDGTYQTGLAPASVAIADVNHDNIPDLVVSNLYSSAQNPDGTFGPGSVSVLLGNGDGTFQAAKNVTTGAGPYVAGIADLNHDGNADLIVLNAFAGFASSGHTDGSVSILWGVGNGSFLTGPTYAVGLDPEALAVADLNHDGQPDIVVANADDNSISVLLGNADGSFRPQVTYQTGLGPNAIGIADLDHDGNPDIVTTNNFDGTLSVLHGNGDGTFSARPAIAVGSVPNSVAIADLNGDGNADLVTANYLDNDVEVQLGNGDGTYRTGVTYAVGSGAYAVSVADVNHDGRLDLLVSSANSGVLSILLGNGDGTFKPQATVATGNFPSLFAVSDLNGDGSPDVVVPNYNDGTVMVLLNVAGHDIGPAYQIDKPAADTPPTITSNGGGPTASVSVPENTRAVTTVMATDPDIGQTLTFSIAGGADAAQFTIDATGALAFVTAPNFEAPTDAGANNVYDVTVQVSDGTLIDTQAIAVGVTNVNEPSSGSAHIASYTQSGNTATLAASNDIVDPDVAHPTVSYQWQASTNGGASWTPISGATSATFKPAAAQVGQLLRVVATYSDPFGSYFLASPETAMVGNGSANTLSGPNTSSTLIGLGGADTLTGGVGNDTLDGGAGADLLNGGLGADTMIGGAGSDTYIVDNPGDVVTELAGGGTDTVETTLLSYVLNANVENLTFIGSGAFTATGNALPNTITGGAGNDLFLATQGDGNDRYDGGAGTDTSSLANTSANATIDLGAGSATSSQIGNDKLTAIENAIGGSGNDRIVSSTAVNVLTGGPGADTFVFNDGASHRGPITTGADPTTRDQITDFQQGLDKIDLSAIDANHTSSTDKSDQAFNWLGLGTIANTALAAQLGYHFETIGGVDHTIIEGTVNTQPGIDLQIDLVGHISLTAGDFVL